MNEKIIEEIKKIHIFLWDKKNDHKNDKIKKRLTTKELDNLFSKLNIKELYLIVQMLYGYNYDKEILNLKSKKAIFDNLYLYIIGENFSDKILTQTLIELKKLKEKYPEYFKNHF